MIRLVSFSTILLAFQAIQTKGYRLPGMDPARLKIFRFSELIDSIKNKFLGPKIVSLLYWKPTVEMEMSTHGNIKFLYDFFNSVPT